MPKAGHILLAVAIPVISIIITIVQHNKKMDDIDQMFTKPSRYELARLQTYYLLQDYIDRILLDKSIARHGDSLTSASARIMREGNYEQVKEDLNRIFIDSLFARNNYFPLEAEGTEKRLVITPGGTMLGLKEFNSFILEDYFSLSNGYGGMDVMTFNTSKGEQEKYNWRFSSDTLILTKLEVSGDSLYELGTESYKYRCKKR